MISYGRWVVQTADGTRRELSDDDVMIGLTVWTALGFPTDAQPLLDVVAAARAYASEPGDWPELQRLQAALEALDV